MPILRQTMALTFEQIRNDPATSAWVPLGNFMHQWFGQCPSLRSTLVEQPLPAHDQHHPDEHRWATFCAASTLYLCACAALPCPLWATAPLYTLKEPWFFYLNHQYLQETTPLVFSSRNIYCGKDVYANKYDLTSMFPLRAPQSMPHKQVITPSL